MIQHSSKSTVFWVGACISWALLVLVLSLMAHPPRVKVPLLSWDKFQHASAYGMLTLLAGRSGRCLWPFWTRVWWWAAGSALIFGFVLEVVQGSMGRGRSADPHDVLANTIGILSATLLVVAWRKFIRPSN